MSRNRALLVDAVDLSPDGVLIVDADGVIEYANTSMVALCGRATEELIGMSVEELVPRDLRRSHRVLRERYSAAPTQRPMGSGLQLSLERADGTLVPVEISLSPIEHEGGQYVVAAVRDVTERRENERRLTAATDALSLAGERARIGRDLHDIVLQHLYGLGLTIQAAMTTATQQLDLVVENIDKIISEVRTIVFTLGTAGPQGPLGQELADVIAQASRLLGFTPAVRMEGPVETVITEELRNELMASMREALGNVARHAKASSAEVVLALSGEHLTMTVSDNGVGPPEDLEAAYSGGHGLMNLRLRAASLDGSCTLAARPGGGAVLTWTAPYRPPSNAPAGR